MTQQLAIVIGADKTSYKVGSIDIPKPAPSEILVEVRAAAQNPTDWKTLQWGMTGGEGFVPGIDFSGIVKEVGSEVTKVKEGDRVASFIHGGSLRAGHGAYAQYLVADGDNLFKIPESVSFDEAAAFPAAFGTAALGLYEAQFLRLPEPYTTPIAKGTYILVWGGSSSVGSTVIQLAKLSGFTVIATASPKNFDYLKSLGADHVFPYSDPTTPAEIHKLTNGQLYLAYDTICEQGSTQGVIDALGSDSEIPAGKKKEVVIILPVDKKDLSEKAENVELKFLLSYTMLGKAVTVYGMDVPQNLEHYKYSIHCLELLQKLLEDGKFKPRNIKVLGGLDKVPEGFEYMSSGKLSAEKIVYRPFETKV